MRLGQIIKDLREEYYKESQQKFSERIGVNRVTLARWESADIEPKRATLKVLLDMAQQAGYAEGIAAFGVRTGPKWIINTETGESTPVQESPFHVAMRVYGNWRTLQNAAADEAKQFYTAEVERGFQELIERLRRGDM